MLLRLEAISEHTFYLHQKFAEIYINEILAYRDLSSSDTLKGRTSA